jgi:hypothetical protein
MQVPGQHTANAAHESCVVVMDNGTLALSLPQFIY